jgi:hypothetical protein
MRPTDSRGNGPNRARRYLFSAFLIMVAVGGTEAALRLSIALVPANPLTGMTIVLPDKVLGHRLNPGYPGHDPDGFRNAGALRKADLVVLGDSMAYGAGIPLERVWPQQLGKLTGMQVYNMAVPGYGPVQSLFLLDRALDLRPTVVLEAFTSANDLYDAFRMAYYLHDLPDLKSTEPDQIAAIRESENRQPLSDLIDKVYNFRSRTSDETLLTKAKGWLDEHVMIYRLLRVVRDRFVTRPEEPNKPSDLRSDAERYPEDLFASGPGVPPTMFTPRYRLAANELDDPRIREGLNVSLRAFERMSRRVAEKGGCFAVVMIPTKEFVYGSAGDDPSSHAPSRTKFLRLLEQERAVWNRTRDYLTAKGIAHVEVAPALSRRLSQGEAVFPVSDDGHPTVAGHDAIAQAVARSGVCGLSAGVR